jgi:hypothetical protein
MTRQVNCFTSSQEKGIWYCGCPEPIAIFISANVHYVLDQRPMCTVASICENDGWHRTKAHANKTKLLWDFGQEPPDKIRCQ